MNKVVICREVSYDGVTSQACCGLPTAESANPAVQTIRSRQGTDFRLTSVVK
jgi:hypothetical protein